jgi:hypothetical protein
MGDDAEAVLQPGKETLAFLADFVATAEIVQHGRHKNDNGGDSAAGNDYPPVHDPLKSPQARPKAPARNPNVAERAGQTAETHT